MNKKFIISFTFSSLLVLPAIALAINFPGFQPGGPFHNIDNLNNATALLIDRIFNFIWMAFAAFAVIMFIWAGILFLNSRGDPAKFAEVRTAVIYGAIGVVVALLSVSIPIIINSVLFS